MLVCRLLHSLVPERDVRSVEIDPLWSCEEKVVEDEGAEDEEREEVEGDVLIGVLGVLLADRAFASLSVIFLSNMYVLGATDGKCCFAVQSGGWGR